MNWPDPVQNWHELGAKFSFWPAFCKVLSEISSKEQDYSPQTLITCKLENRLDKICPPKGLKLDNFGKNVEKATLPEPVRVENGAFMWVSVRRNVCNGRKRHEY